MNRYPILPKRLTFTKRALAEIMEMAEGEIDIILAQEMREINRFCRAVLTNIRFEHTTFGVRMFLSGVNEERSYRIVSEVDSFYLNLGIIETFLVRQVYSRRQHKKKLKAELALRLLRRQHSAVLVLQRFIRVVLAKQRVALLHIYALSNAPKKKGSEHIKKMSSIAMMKLNMFLSLYCTFRGVEVTINGKYFKRDDGWCLLIHAKEGGRLNLLETGKKGMNGSDQGEWPLNAQTIVDEDYIRYMCGNIEELQGQDLVDMDALLANRLHRILVFNALPGFIDVVLSRQKGRMAIKLLKYIEL